MSDRPTYVPDDALLDELDASIMVLGRFFSSRHGSDCDILSGPRLLVLRFLSEHDQVKTGDLAALLGVKAPATTALIDGLVRDGLVARQHGCCDRRVTFVALTQAGRDALVKAEQQRRKYMRHFLSGLNEEDVRTLVRIHNSIISAVSADL